MKAFLKIPFTQALLLSLFALAGCGKSDAPPEHQSATPDAHTSSEEHSHGADHSSVVTPPEGERWATDEPLREAMTRLRAAIDQAIPAHENGTFGTSDAQALAQTVEKEVTFMIENCKLAPQPDAALHVLIGRMMSAAGGLIRTPIDPDAVPELARVLHDYGETFDHPGWTL